MERQSLGCGYEPPNDRVHLQLWEPPDGRVGYRGGEPTVCPRYTTQLPEVREALIARAHWSTGNLAVACAPDLPSEDLLHAIVILEGGFSEVQRWAMTPAKDGGGGG